MDHEAALLRWGNLLLAQREELAGFGFQRAVELRKKAADVRDAADKRMEDHKRSCPVCKDNSRKLHLVSEDGVSRVRLESSWEEAKMSDQDEQENKTAYFTALIRALLTEKPHGYKADPIPVPGHLYQWRIYDAESPALVQILAPQHSDLTATYDETVEQQRAFLSPLIDDALNALKAMNRK